MSFATPDISRRAGSPASEFGDVRQTAAILNVSASFLNKARLYGGGPPYAKFGKNVRYHLPTAMQWAKEQTRRSTSDVRTEGRK